jgi:hypothetical protein
MRYILIFLPFLLGACNSSPSSKPEIDSRLVNYIEIAKQSDSSSFKMTKGQAAQFIREWNRSSSVGLYKFWPEYFVTVHFKKDSTFLVRINDGLVKGKGDDTYAVADKQFFKETWFQLTGLH